MIPMFRVFASGTARATMGPTFLCSRLPLEVAEGPVGLGHLVGVLASLHRRAEAVHRVDELGGELLAHALAAALAGGLDEPAHAERQPAIAPDLHRDLVGRATDAPRLHLDDRGRVAQRRLEHLEARALGLEFGARQRLAQDPVGQRPLPIAHQLRAEAIGDAVRLGLVLGLARDRRTARHRYLFPTAGAALAPYFERPCLRSLTPAASRVPRMMWYFTDGRSLTRPPRTRTTECSWRLWPIPGM